MPGAQMTAPGQAGRSPDVPAKHFLLDVLTAAGHVTPTLPLVAELVRRGHRVGYATGRDHAVAVRAAGANWVPLPTFPPLESSDLSVDGFKRFLRHYFAAQRATYLVLLAHCTVQRPDVLCRDATNWPGRLVATRLGIPDACTFPHLASNEHFSMAARTAAGVGGGDPVTDALGGSCEEFSAEQGMLLRPHERLWFNAGYADIASVAFCGSFREPQQQRIGHEPLGQLRASMKGGSSREPQLVRMWPDGSLPQRLDEGRFPEGTAACAATCGPFGISPPR